MQQTLAVDSFHIELDSSNRGKPFRKIERVDSCLISSDGPSLKYVLFQNLSGAELLGASDPYVVLLQVINTKDTSDVVAGVEYAEDVSWLESESCKCSLELYYSSTGYTQYFFYAADNNNREWWKTDLLNEGEELNCDAINFSLSRYSTSQNGETSSFSFLKVDD